MAILGMGLNARKPVFCGFRRAKAHTSLPIRAFRSAPLLFSYWKVSYQDLLRAKFYFSSSLSSRGERFESRYVGNTKDKATRPILEQHKCSNLILHVGLVLPTRMDSPSHIDNCIKRISRWLPLKQIGAIGIELFETSKI